MPYSMKQKPISTEEPLSCPFGQDGAGKKNKPSRFPPAPHLNTAPRQSWGWFTAVTGEAVLFWHSYIVLQHNASPLLKVTVEGRIISFLNLLLYANWHALPICNSIMPMKKSLGRKKRHALMNFLFKDFNVFKTLGDFCLWQSLAQRSFYKTLSKSINVCLLSLWTLTPKEACNKENHVFRHTRPIVRL